MKFLTQKDGIIYAKCTNCGRILKFKKYELDEIKSGVECFCGNISNTIEGLPKNNIPERMNNTPTQTQPTVPIKKEIVQQGPVCPTCGSRNISKISLGSKAIGGVVFGIFSSNIRNTFKCNDCGYKW